MNKIILALLASLAYQTHAHAENPFSKYAAPEEPKETIADPFSKFVAPTEPKTKTNSGFNSECGSPRNEIFVRGSILYGGIDYPTMLTCLNAIAASDQGPEGAQFALAEMYILGKGVAIDKKKGIEFLKKSAELGYAKAQLSLGKMYITGKEGQVDEKKGVEWIKKAAEQGLSDAQHSLGLAYAGAIEPSALSQDYYIASTWFQKAADQGDPRAQETLGMLYAGGLGVSTSPSAAIDLYYKAATGYLKLGMRTKALITLDMIIEISPNHPYAKKLTNLLYEDTPQVSSKTQKPTKKSKKTTVTGSGFYINNKNIVTNNHVVKGCEDVLLIKDKNKMPGHIIARDKINDLAVIRVEKKHHAYATIQSNVSATRGEHIMVAGYPLQSFLSSELKVTTGVVNSTSGIDNDSRYLQISAPVQPGNSGGPLLNRSGYVSGVVVSKLDAVKIAKVTGDIPQNVNSAIKSPILRSFLDIHKIHYTEDTLKDLRDDAYIAALANNFVIAIQCGPD